MEEVWDRIFEREGENYFTPLVNLEKILPLMKKLKVRRVLDVGCGAGKHMLFLAMHGFEVYGVDISGKALETANGLFRKNRIRAEFYKLDIYEGRFPFPDGFFDAVISFNVLHHNRITKIRRAFFEIYRVLRKGGIFYATLKAWRPRNRMHRSRFLDKHTIYPTRGERGRPDSLCVYKKEDRKGAGEIF